MSGDHFAPEERQAFDTLVSALADELEAARLAMEAQGIQGGHATSVMLSALATCVGAVLVAMLRPPARAEYVTEISRQLHLTLLRQSVDRAGRD